MNANKQLTGKLNVKANTREIKKENRLKKTREPSTREEIENREMAEREKRKRTKRAVQ